VDFKSTDFKGHTEKLSYLYFSPYQTNFIMTNNPNPQVFNLNNALREFATHQLPTLEKEINAVIARKETSLPIIESLLKLSSMLTQVGVGKTAYEQLCQYYVTVKQQNKD
jgi:hypothetical protein